MAREIHRDGAGPTEVETTVVRHRGSRRSSRWRLPLVALTTASVLIAACLPASSPQVRPATPKEEGSPLRYKNDIVRVAKEFIGREYLKYGLHAGTYPNDLETDITWNKKPIDGRVIEIVETGPGGKQRFLISNTYNSSGGIFESHISTYSMAVPTGNIDLRVLPGINLPHRDGFGEIPTDMLFAAAQAVFQLPQNLEWAAAESCYTLPFDPTVRTAPALTGRGEIKLGRTLRLRIDGKADGILLITDKSAGKLPIPGLCPPKQSAA